MRGKPACVGFSRAGLAKRHSSASMSARRIQIAWLIIRRCKRAMFATSDDHARRKGWLVSRKHRIRNAAYHRRYPGYEPNPLRRKRFGPVLQVSKALGMTALSVLPFETGPTALGPKGVARKTFPNLRNLDEACNPIGVEAHCSVLCGALEIAVVKVSAALYWHCAFIKGCTSAAGGASQPATTDAPTPSSRPSAAQQPSSSGSDQ